MNILCIGDPHAKPGIPNDRFLWAGRLAADFLDDGDAIVNIGDWADFPSLSSYDKGRACFEGRRYKADCAAANEAISFFESGLHHRQISSKKKRKSYRKFWHRGNHDQRADRVGQADPGLNGVLSPYDIRFREAGWQLIDYEGSAPGTNEVEGITFAHFFVSGIHCKPISGEHPAYSIITKKHTSCVGGDTHVFDYCQRNRADGSRIQALVCGCYLAKDQFEDYAGPANRMWWRGLTILKRVVNGTYDFERISIEEIEKEYG